ncbi:MAG: hypothetical protein KIS70_14030, partial [Xanthobacteraceae bacterium]|nr:hypothetical protein [Xanthobacteraceae bacterium]
SVPPRYTPQRAPNQPLPPEQAYPTAHQQYQQQNQQPLAISPQQQHGPIEQQRLQAPQQQTQQPQYLQAPQQQPQYLQQPPQQNYPQPRMQWQQGPQPAPYDPNRPVPPARVGAKKNADDVVTGSIKNRKYYKDLPPPNKNAPKIVPGED